MRMRKLCILLLAFLICILSACSKEEKTTSKPASKITVGSEKAILKKDNKSWKNHYNYFTNEDNDYVYFIEALGVYKISKTDNQVTKVTGDEFSNTNIGFSLCLHNNYIYFVTSKGLRRINKDGTNYTKLNDVKTTNLKITCNNDTLYSDVYLGSCRSKTYCYDIKSDSEQPKLLYTNDKGVAPMPDNKIYYWYPDKEGIAGHIFSSDIDNKNVKKYDKKAYAPILVSKNYIFYCCEQKDQIAALSKNSKDCLLVASLADEYKIERIITCDDEYLYFITTNSNDKRYVCKAKIADCVKQNTTIKNKLLPNFKDDFITQVDIVDDYVYIIYKGKAMRAKIDDSKDFEYIVK